MPWLIAMLGLGVFLFAVKFGFAKEIIANANKKVGSGTTGNSLSDIIASHSKRYSVPIALINAIIENESSFNQYAKNPNDPSYGYMGIMPIVAQDFGIVNNWRKVTDAEIQSIYIPYNNIGSGTKLLGKLLAKYDIPTTIEMYNVGETGWKDGRRNSAYVSKVLDDYHKYQSQG